MFLDNPNLEKLADKIYLYKNFVPQEEVKRINDIMSNFSPEDFIEEGHAVEWYRDKEGPPLWDLIPTWDKISELIGPELVIHPQLSLLVMKPGDSEFIPHCDSPGEGMEEELTEMDRFNTCCVLSYGVCAYFGDFEGGEIYYPNQNLVVPVRPGDLIIHGAHSDCLHGVKIVTKGMRYCYSNFAMKAEKAPKTFAHYGTQEDLDRKANGTWYEVIESK